MYNYTSLYVYVTYNYIKHNHAIIVYTAYFYNDQPLTRIVRGADNTGVVHFELVAEQVSTLLPSSSLEVGCSRKVPPEVLLFFPLTSLLVMENSGGGRLWPVQLMVVEEPLFTEAGVDRSATSVGGSVQDSNVEIMLRKPPNGGLPYGQKQLQWH